MIFGRPDVLLWLWATPVLVLFAWLVLRSRRRALARLGALVDDLVTPGAARRHGLRLVLTVVGICAVVVALAQPRWGYRWQELQREGLELVVVVDVSRSMLAEDVSPSRMERARREVLDLADMLGGDRVGMVIFAGGAYPWMPLTLDYGALRQRIGHANVETLRAQGSDLGGALDVAVAMLGEPTGADRALLLITDGEDHPGQAREAAQRAADAGVHIFVLGVGTDDGAPIPVQGGGFKKDSDGRVVLSRIDQDLLQDLARIGSGAYVRSVAGTADLRGLYEGEIRGKLQAAELGVRRDKIWNERYQWPLGVGLGLVALGQVLRPRRKRRRARLAQAAAVVLAAAVLDPAPVRAADTDALLTEAAARPDDLSLAEQAARALYEAGEYSRAGELLGDVADRAIDPAQRARARYNQGLAEYRAGRLTQAVEAWDRVLESDPEHAAAAGNAQAVRQELAQRLQQPPPDQDQGQDGEPQDGEQGDSGAPQDGEPQDGQQGDTASQDGQQGDTASQDGEPSNGEPPPQGDGTRQDRPQDAQPGADTGQGGELTPAQPDQGDTGTPIEGGEGGEPAQPEDLSATEAKRLFDGVEEGAPRVVIGDPTAQEKDW